MRSIFTLVLATIALSCFSQTTYTANSGTVDWDSPTSWTPNGIPDNNDIVIILSTSIVKVKGNVYDGNNGTALPNITIQISGTLYFEPSGILNLGSASSIQLYSASSKIESQNSANSQLIKIGGTVKYNADIDGTVTGPKFTNSSTGTSGSAGTGFSVGVLPIKLRSFTAQTQGSRIALNWITDEELNTSHFVIERSSNARNWSSIQTVAAKGEAAGYTTTDATPASGDNFYRLKSVDIDGKFEYSHVLKVVRGRSLAVHVSPNPASEQVTVSLSSPSSAPVQLQLVNNNGQVVSEKLYATGTSLIQFDLGNAAPGVYTLLLRNGNTLMETTQLLIK
jgi:hypothetical protein